MKRRLEKILLFVVALSMLITMLPGAAMGEAQSAAAKSFVEKKPYVDSVYEILRESENLPVLPQGANPVEKIIPRRCMIVRHNYEFTIPVVVAPATISALKDFAFSWNSSKLDLARVTSKANSNRVTLYFTFTAIGKPTDTTQVIYQSISRKAVKSRTYVTIVPTPVKSVQIEPPTMMAVTETQQLIASVMPKQATNKAVKWYSTNKNVATVSTAGLVTAIAPGMATIYVVTVSGHKKAKCVVQVGQPAK